MIHINNFIDKIKFFESKNSKDFIIPLSEAKNLHSDITKLLLVLQETQITKQPSADKSTSKSNISGGQW